MSGLTTARPQVFLAHAFGARYDLPLPLWLFVLGGAVIVLVSFLLVAHRPVAGLSRNEATDETHVRSWRRDDRLRLLPAAAGTVSVAFLGFLIWAGLTGSQEIPENILPTWFWLIVWIAIPLSCGLLGDWTQPVNPVAALARLADQPRLRRLLLGSERPVNWPGWLGWWPAVVLYFVTACGELIFNVTLTVPRNTALALLCYTLASAVASFLFGPTWLRRGEMFTVLYATWGRLGCFRFGAPGRRGFGGGVDAVPFEKRTSRIAFVLFLLISVNFDGLLATPRWNRFESATGYSLHPHQLEAFRVVAFVVLAAIVAAVFAAFAYASSRAGRHGGGVRGALAGLLPSMVPIAFGYLLAHNLQYVLVNSQLLAPLIGNPTGTDSWPLHLPYPFNDDYEPHVKFLPSAFYWYVSVAVIVAVHVIAVFVAHRHLMRRAPERAAAHRSEYPWLVAMVAYTMFSLWLIAQPLVKEGPATTSSALPPGSVAASTVRR